MRENRLTNKEAGSQQTPSIQFLDVLRKHLAIYAEHYRQPISELSVLAYAQDLKMLSPQTLDEACVKARQTSGFMPVSAKILECAKDSARIAETFLGPPLLEYGEKSAEEIAFNEKWRKYYAENPLPEKPEVSKLRPQQSTMTIEEQKAELRRRGLL